MYSLSLSSEGEQPIEAGEGVRAVAKKRRSYLIQGLSLAELRLAVELIRVADYTLFLGLWRVYPLGEVYAPEGDLLGSQARARMTLCYMGMTRKPDASEELGTEVAVLDVWLRTMAVDAWGVGEVDADVVEHRRLVEEGLVERPFGVSLGNF